MGTKILRAMPLLALTAFCLSCSSSGKYDFKNGDDAITAYRDYLVEVRNLKTSNTKDFTSELCHWRELNDTVWHYLQTQQEYLDAHSHADMVIDIHDSVRYEMLRLAETWRYSYQDVLSIKEHTSSFRDDKDLQSAVGAAGPFFLSLDSVPLLNADKNALLTQYKLFLIEQKNMTFLSKEDMIDFIRREDLFFRSFLSKLYDMEGEPLSEITKNTEAICKNIFIAAREGRISARDVMVYMSMRTVRRLLQNSVVCVTDINQRDMISQSQGNAYLWMIIQPFISIDQFAIATLTPQEKSDFNYIISRLPKSPRFAKVFDIEQSSLNYLLPQQLLKIYILSL